MPRLTADTWETVRAEREAGATFGELADRFGVNKAAIVRRSKKEGWGDGTNVADVVRRKVAEKVTGMSPDGNPKKKAEAIDAAASRGAAIITRHQRDWDRHHEQFTVDGVADDFNLGKSAKICAEMLAIRQKAERVAHGLEVSEAGDTIIKNPRGFDD